MKDKKGIIFGAGAFIYNLINIVFFTSFYIRNPTLENGFITTFGIIFWGVIFFKILKRVFKLVFKLSDLVAQIGFSIVVNVIFALERLEKIEFSWSLIFYALIMLIISMMYGRKKNAST